MKLFGIGGMEFLALLIPLAFFVLGFLVLYWVVRKAVRDGILDSKKFDDLTNASSNSKDS